ncbi:MAG TPA: hypothetical protein VHZ03_33800 [Trebonia sp.]|nr:hypothetical protein [Trebonia sp.]
MAVEDGDAVAEVITAGDDAADDGVAVTFTVVVALGVAVAVEAPAALYPDAAEDAANVLAIESPIARTAPTSKVMWGDLSFMLVVRPEPAFGSLSGSLEAQTL